MDFHHQGRSVSKDLHMQIPLVMYLKYTIPRLQEPRISIVHSSLFIRHYFGKPIWFIILHLLICLN